MSTFTDWNGPQGGGVRAADLIQLANAYSELVTRLNEHMNDRTPGTSDVHGIKTYIEAKIAAISELIPSIDGLISEANADAKYQEKIEDINDFVRTETLNNYATKEDVATALSDYLKKNKLSAQQIILDIQKDITAIEGVLNADIFEMPVLKATKYVEGLIHAIEQIQFTFKQIRAEVSGSNDLGVYYLLGMLDDRAGTAYIRYTDTDSFAAVVHFAVTARFDSENNVSDYKGGQLSITTDAHLTGLTDIHFLIVKGTSEGKPHAYLAIQAADWISNFASTDGVGYFDSLPFEVAGINFYPAGSEDYVKPVGLTSMLQDVAYTDLRAGFEAIQQQVEHLQDVSEQLNQEVIERTEADAALDTRLKSIEEEFPLTYDDTLDNTSENAVQNKIVSAKLEELESKINNSLNVQVGETMYWHLQDDSSPENREVHSDNPFVFTFKGQEVSVETHDGHVQLCKLKDIPDGWHALDGTTELLATDYPDLAAFMPENVTTDGKIWLPYVQHKIIKIKY